MLIYMNEMEVKYFSTIIVDILKIIFIIRYIFKVIRLQYLHLKILLKYLINHSFSDI